MSLEGGCLLHHLHRPHPTIYLSEWILPRVNSLLPTRVPGTTPRCEPKPFEQTASGFEGFQQRLRAYGLEPDSILIVMEATASYWVSLATTLSQAGFAVSVINPAQAHHFAKAQLKRAKTDALDAQTLAELAQALVPERWTPPPHIYYELQQRLAQRSSLLELRTQVSNQLHALSVIPTVVPAVSRRFKQLIETINQQIAQLDAELLELVKVEQESGEKPAEEEQRTDRIEQKWKAAIALLVSIPGIGLLTASWLVVATLNFTLCESAEAAVHYVGLAPMIRLSGTSIRGRAQIGHSGHTRARTQLYVATRASARFHPVIKPYYERLRAAGKPMKVARCACARKLLHIAYAVVKHEQAFDPD
ncbi:MAG TPA: IS110 family transposase, partial [Ktedonobacteraceae bacterium]|nr:IS110 family transposase [Ktedonobacteraceae bacterium]